MTIRITPGSLPTESIYSLRCDRCGTEFTCQESDTYPSSERCDRNDRAVICPLTGCGRIVWTEGRAP